MEILALDLQHVWHPYAADTALNHTYGYQIESAIGMKYWQE